MKIQMLENKVAAGPGGKLLPGRVYVVSEKRGKALIDGGYAREVGGSTEGVEVVSLAPPEKAVKKRGRPRKPPPAEKEDDDE